MGLLNRHRTPPVAHSLRVLAALLSYPDAAHRAWLDEFPALLDGEAALSIARREELKTFIRRLSAMDALAVEADYVQLFDGGRATSLHLFEHVHGDSRDRGPAMVDLVQTYEQNGLMLAPHELPDFLPVILEFASTRPAEGARAFLGEFTHLLQSVFSALVKRESAYASVLGALIELGGGRAEPVAFTEDAPLDDTWEEPPVFGGCSTVGQAKPGQPQPIHLIKKPVSPGARP
ncbi:MAG: nitrate reductase molybdenum cofactor assembly chaperone [Rubrivivax sp.]|nr:nitrate reductase molybdenum cofactor assembly chaperone [Rubrivivax sp.]